MKSINIKGKEYIQVNERIKEFRSNKNYEGFSIETDLLVHQGDLVVFKTTIKDANGRTVATGHAHEVKSDDFKDVNSTSHFENAETSSVGRALGFLGIGIDTSIATAEEVSSAIEKQEVLSTTQNPDQVRRIQRVTAGPNGRVYNDGPKPGEEAMIDGHPCRVFVNKSNGNRFWADTTQGVRWTKAID